eukprot:2225-Heterococcus_DN1.PRE.1
MYWPYAGKSTQRRRDTAAARKLRLLLSCRIEALHEHYQKAAGACIDSEAHLTRRRVGLRCGWSVKASPVLSRLWARVLAAHRTCIITAKLISQTVEKLKVVSCIRGAAICALGLQERPDAANCTLLFVSIVAKQRRKMQSRNDVGEAAAAVPAAEASPVHQQDHALVRDLMEYFCFAVKANTKFRGT